MKTLKLSILLLGFLSLISFTKADSTNDDQILWESHRKLVWEDFEGRADAAMPNIEALTASTIEVSTSYYDKEVPKFDVYSYFIKSQSWTKTDSEFTLEHEQLHFDITEIHARKIRKAFQELNKRKVRDISKYQDIHARYGKACTAYQNAYDKSVYGNDAAQAEWSKKIADELLLLKDYVYIPE